MSRYSHEADGFVRTPWDEPPLIHDPELIALARGLSPDADAETRARAAQELGRPLGYLKIWHGPPYTAWRVDDSTVLMSLLPGASIAQPFLAVELQLTPDRLRLVARWTTEDPAWAPIRHEEYVRSLKGLMSDRRGIPLGRESALKVLLDRGARFRFPAVPVDGLVEPLCGWLQEEPSGGALAGWDRNPLLVDPALDILYVLNHSPTRAALLPYRIQGSWSDEALAELGRSSDTLLPCRFILRPLRHGCARFAVFLGLVDPVDPHLVRSPYDWDRAQGATLFAVLELCAAVLARFVGRDRGLALDPPDPTSAAPAPGDRAAKAFRHAEAAMGDAEFVSPSSGGWVSFDESTGLDIAHRLLSVADIQSAAELRRYVSDRESNARALARGFHR